MRSLCPQVRAFSVVCALFSAVTFASTAVAQSSKVEIVPGIPHCLPGHSVAFSSDGARIASASRDETVKLWDVATGHLIRTFEGPTSYVNAVANDRSVKLWDPTTGQLAASFEGHADPVTAVAFSPNGERFASGSATYTRYRTQNERHNVRVWDTATGRSLLTLQEPSGGIYSTAFSPDGTRLLTGADKGSVKLWDATTGKIVRNFEGSKSRTTAVAFLPDGTRVLSGHWDKAIRIWDGESGQLLRTLQGHSDPVQSVAISADGARRAAVEHVGWPRQLG